MTESIKNCPPASGTRDNIRFSSILGWRGGDGGEGGEGKDKGRVECGGGTEDRWEDVSAAQEEEDEEEEEEEEEEDDEEEDLQSAFSNMSL